MNTRVTVYLVGTVSRLLLVSAGPGDGVSDPEPDSTVCSGGLAVAGVEQREPWGVARAGSRPRLRKLVTRSGSTSPSCS